MAPRIPRHAHFFAGPAWAIFFWLSAVVAGGAGPAPSPASLNPRYTGTPIMQTWGQEEFGVAHDVYRTLQHPQTGLIYIGVNGGILEYDGVRMRLIGKRPFDAQTLVFDGRGRLWKGASNDIQRVTPNEAGEWESVSYSERPPPGSERISHAYWSARGPRGVYLADYYHLYHFADADDTARGWKVAGGRVEVAGLWQMAGVPWVALTDGTVLRLRDGAIERVPGLAMGAYAARQQADGSWYWLTSKGVDRWDGTALTGVSRPCGDDLAQSAVFLTDGRLAFGTKASGVILCDAEGKVLQRIDRTDGLPNNMVRHVMEDREGGLWVSQVSTVTRVQLDSPYARHGPRQGLEGVPQCFAEHRGAFYFGTTEGLWRREADGSFAKISGVVPTVRFLVSHGDDLYIVAGRLHVLGVGDGDRARTLDSRDLLGFVPLAGAPGIFMYGCREGIAWARSDGRNWQQEGVLNATNVVSAVVFQGPPGIVWARGGAGMWRVDLRAGPSATAPALLLTPERGLPHRDVRMFLLGDDPVAVTQDSGHGQMLRFDEASGKLAPELRITGLPKSDRYPAAASDVDRVIVDGDGTIWLQMPEPQRRVFRATRDGPDRWRAEALPGPTLFATRANTLWHQPATRTLWVAAPGGLLSRDLDWHPRRELPPPAAIVRRVALASGKSLFGGAVPPGAAVRPLTLRPEQDALRVSFAAPSFLPNQFGKTATLYRTRLDGLDRDWSAWTPETQRDFTNLAWRDFTFRVQARDGAGEIGPEGAYRFSLVAPWWATRWAWAGYGVLGLLGVSGVVRLRTGVLRRRAELLEHTIAQRTRELADSNAQLATQNTELARLHQLELDEKIAAQLSEEKARLELLRYQLNPHFLLNAFTTLRSLVFSSPDAAGRTIDRLSDFCRLALTRSEENGATIGDEIRLIESYLDTEQARWRDELQVELRVDPAALPCPLPPFLLQPLVENAIKYGGRTSPGTLRVRVDIGWDGDSLVIAVANTGTWVEAGSRHRAGSTGIGFANLRQRLLRRYRDAHEFTTEARDGWVWVRLRLRPNKNSLSRGGHA